MAHKITVMDISESGLYKSRPYFSNFCTYVRNKEPRIGGLARAIDREFLLLDCYWGDDMLTCIMFKTAADATAFVLRFS